MKNRYTPANAEAFLAHLPDDAPARLKAKETLSTRGLPTPKLERWKYTNIAGFLQSGATPAPKTTLATSPVALPWVYQNSRKFVFVNGHMLLGDTRLKITPEQFDDAPVNRFDDATLWSLNAALAVDGANINILEDGAVFEIIHIGQAGDAAQLASTRTNIRVATGINATLVEQFIAIGDAPVHGNHALQITLKPDATLNHIRIQFEGAGRTLLTSTHTRIAKSAAYKMNFLNMGAGTSRQEFWAELDEEGAHCAIKGAQMMAGRQLMDTTIQIDHKAPNGTSNQTIRNVLTGEAVGVFQGKIFVERIAQKTDGYQLCNSLMLSDRATMNTKPELEIYADDVKCSHGTTTGQLDDGPLFYMRARGIPEAEAKRLLLLSFIGDVFDDVPDYARKLIDERVEGWLEHV